MSASTTPTEWPCCGERDREVGRDARLADAALAGRDQQRTGLRAGLGERDPAALGVAVRLCRGRRVAAGSPCSLVAQRLALVVGHHGEVEVRRRAHPRAARPRRSPGSGSRCAAGTRRRSGRSRTRTSPSALIVDVADHAEVDDRAVQLGILDRAEGLDDLVGGGHGRVLCDRWVRGIRRGANYHYGHR